MSWTIIPFINNVEMTMQAAADFLRQEGVGESRVLIVDNGASEEERERVDYFAALQGEVCLVWHHQPALLSLSATWNRALRFVWEQGERVAVVANNDVRVTKDTFLALRTILDEEKAMLVTATGVEEEETLFKEAQEQGQERMAYDECILAEIFNGEYREQKLRKVKKGGPGFSCFMISKEGHEKYPFDEMLTPAFCEDLDMHRRMILGGDGGRIFGTNVRYLHLGGQTLKAMGPERRVQVERAISSGSRAYYARKWGGGANEETLVEPFVKTDTGCLNEGDLPEWVVARWEKGESVTTPALFEEVRRGW
jgi:GT2 family glycosyltransferase